MVFQGKNIDELAIITHECPYCKGRCQFDCCLTAQAAHFFCEMENLYHMPYQCLVCNGIIIIKQHRNSDGYFYYNSSIPPSGEFKPGNLDHITSTEEVKKDFLEAIECYNNSFYNASMIMCRRAVQQEVTNEKAKGENLYKQIESLGISDNLKILLQGVRIFGNSGAHPDPYGPVLLDKEIPIKEKQDCAKLSLEFLDLYLRDQRGAFLAKKVHKSKKELGNDNTS